MISHSRSNERLFSVPPTGSPIYGNMKHISELGHGRIYFERCKVTGDVIFSIEGDLAPTSQQDEEARVGSLSHALLQFKSLPEYATRLVIKIDEVEYDPVKEDAAEFMRCLNEICREGDSRSRQVVASYYYGRVKEVGASKTLMEMGHLARHLSSLNLVTEESESDCEIFYAPPRESRPRPLFNPFDPNMRADAADILAERFDNAPAKVENQILRKLLFDYEVDSIKRMIRGRRRAAGFVHEDWAESYSELLEGGGSSEEIDSAFKFYEAQEQYDEGGAVIRMTKHERTVTRGRLDPEYTVEDLPQEARHLAGELLHAYVNGVDIEEIWNEIDKQIYRLFPIHLGIDGPEFPRRTNLTRGLPDYRLSREEMKAMDPAAGEVEGGQLRGDVHLTALRNNITYRRFFMGIRCATHAGRIAEVMNQACLAPKSGAISHEELKRLQNEKDKQNHRLLSSKVVIYDRPNYISHANREIQIYIQEVLEAFLSECEEDFHLRGLRKNKAYRVFHAQLRHATTQAEVSDAQKQAYQARREGRLPLKLFTGLCATATKQRERLRSKPVGGGAYKLIEEILTANEKGIKRISWEMFRQNRPTHPIHTFQEHEAALCWDTLNLRKAVSACRLIYTTWARAAHQAFVPVDGKQYPVYFMFMALLQEFLDEPYLRNPIRAVLNKQPSPQKDTSSPKQDSSTPRRSAAPAKKGGDHSNAISSAPPA